MLVRPGFEPATSRPADRRSPNWANQAAVWLLAYSPVDNWFCRFILVGSPEPQKASWNEVKVLWVCWAHCRKMFVRICFGLRPKAQRESKVHQILFSSTSWSPCLLQGKTSQSPYLPSYHAYFSSNLSCKRPFWIAWSLSSASELITRDPLWFFSRKRGALSLRFLGGRLREVRLCLEVLVCFTVSLCKFVATAFPYCLNFDTLSVVHNRSILKVTISSFIGVKSSTSRRLTRRTWDWFSLKRSTICRGA